jgi:hypothetical protein
MREHGYQAVCVEEMVHNTSLFCSSLVMGQGHEAPTNWYLPFDQILNCIHDHGDVFDIRKVNWEDYIMNISPRRRKLAGESRLN